jgi:hypothetical protein
MRRPAFKFTSSSTTDCAFYVAAPTDLMLLHRNRGHSYVAPQEGDVDPELTALTSTAATTVVKLLATAAWEQATSAVGRLWRRVHPERAQTVQAELADSRAEVLAARQVGGEQVEQALVGEWQSRLRRLVAADPQLVDELRQVVVELRSALTEVDPPQGSTITMQVTAFGNSRVNQAGHDLHVTEK